VIADSESSSVSSKSNNSGSVLSESEGLEVMGSADSTSSSEAGSSEVLESSVVSSTTASSKHSSSGSFSVIDTSAMGN